MSDKNNKGLISKAISSYQKLYNNNTRVAEDIAKSISGLPGNVIGINKATSKAFDDSVSKFPKRIYNDSSVDINSLITEKRKDNGIENYLEKALDSEENILHASSAYRETLETNKVYDDYDMICRYMPQLDDCLIDFKSNIFSPDETIKSTINIKLVGGSSENNESLSEKLIRLKKRYKLDINMNKIIYNTLKYGRQPVYCKDYSEVMAYVLNSKSENRNTINESTQLAEGDYSIDNFDAKLLSENIVLDEFKKTKPDNTYDKKVSDKLSSNLIKYTNEKFVISDSIMTSVVHDVARLVEANVIDMKDSVILNEDSSTNEVSKSKDELVKIMKDFVKADISKKDNSLNNVMGVIDEKEYKPKDIKVKGSLFKITNIRNLVPLKINDIPIAYYYFEESANMNNTIQSMYQSPTDGFSLRDVNDRYSSNNDDMNDNVILKNISNLLVKRLNKKFIESNPEFTDLIYEFCKYNGILKNGKKYNIQYIKAEDIINFEVDGGISKLDRSLFPAKLYCILLMSNMMAKVSRGNDKRAFYVKQGIDTNVAQTMMDTIIQIKKSEFAANDITNMNKVFGLVGRFNDIFIPTSPNGDRPFEVDVIAGQDTQIKDEFLEFLERIAINVTGTPSAAIEFRNEAEYSRSLSMANAKYARSILTNQTELHDPTSELVTKLYRAEYESNEELEAVYPAPKTLINQNTSDQFRTAQEMVEVILKSALGDNPNQDVYDKMYRILMIKYGPVGINYDEILKIKKNVEVELAKPDKTDDDNSSSGYSSSY